MSTVMLSRAESQQGNVDCVSDSMQQDMLTSTIVLNFAMLDGSWLREVRPNLHYLQQKVKK